MARKQKERSPTPSVRQSVLDNPKAQKKYLAALAKGTARTAAAVVGLTRNGAARYRRDHPEFMQQCREAEAIARGSIEAKIFEKAIEKSDWEALKFVAERKYWDEWSRRSPETYSLKDLLRFAAALGQAMASALPADHQVAARRIIDQQMELFLLGGTGGK